MFSAYGVGETWKGGTKVLRSSVVTTFLLDEGGVIRWIYRPDTYRMRASVDEILSIIDGQRAA